MASIRGGNFGVGPHLASDGIVRVAGRKPGGASSGPPSGVHLQTQLGCCDPQGATSCGSPMPRGERIAKPA